MRIGPNSGKATPPTASNSFGFTDHHAICMSETSLALDIPIFLTGKVNASNIYDKTFQRAAIGYLTVSPV